MDKLDEALAFFRRKLCVAYGEFSQEENTKLFEDNLKFVDSWGVLYEVYTLAYKEVSEDSTFDGCVNELSHAMCEWDV